MKKMILGTTVCASLLLVALGGCGQKEEIQGTIESGKVTETSTSLSGGVEEVAGEATLKDDGYFKEIITGDKDPKVKLEAEYKTDWTDSSWENVDFNIDKVKVVEVDKFKDDQEKDYKGLMSMHYTLENKGEEEVKVRPKEATIVLKDGKEVKADHFLDIWDDVFAKDHKKDGYIHFKFNDTDQIDSIKEIKISFTGHKKDSSEDKVDHTYDVTLPLELAK
ncbi:hypothetical protein CBF34_08180 [Vagococcus penaei]|uniref:Uncharacterized protein n=1 Tax=Vagococcus penaei TaxID=633807 RepID=A0A1Q2D532_9ENTE|nr:hypothetical protein [Vagococcus penaei]AQP53469.1 hypothetical protein BW732_03915 [Vagococcus penaei]RSU00859.1 hypothetical protein CBF34_08180 [Vagococcus penaei]